MQAWARFSIGFLNLDGLGEDSAAVALSLRKKAGTEKRTKRASDSGSERLVS
jgi:hypothetical protein